MRTDPVASLTTSAVCRRAGARFSVTTGMNPSIKRAVLGIPHDAWQHISYPTAVPDPETGDVRRVRDLAKPAVVGEQDELFPVWRYHPFFTDQPAATLRAER